MRDIIFPLTAVALIFLAAYYFAVRAEDRTSSLPIHQQLKTLNEIETNIRQLSEFIITQRKNLLRSEVAIQKLQKEHEDLQTERNKITPLIEADRKLIESIFLIQKEQAQKNYIWDLAVSFGLGILSSFVASFVLNRFRPKRPSLT